MIIKSIEAKKREFLGVNFDVLVTSKNLMLTKMNFKEKDNVPLHSHPNEQCGYVVSGEYKLTIGSKSDVIKAGDSYLIPENIEHTVEIIKAGIILDIFSPPRKDYI